MFGTPLRAGLLTLSLAVSVAQATSCSVSSGGVSFGAYSPITALPQDSIGTITVTCSVTLAGLLSYQVNLSTGAGSYSQRQMVSGPNALNYNLFTDPLHLFVWGDGTSGTSAASYGLIVAIGQSINPIPVFGRVATGQNPRAGTYSDSLVISVIY